VFICVVVSSDVSRPLQPLTEALKLIVTLQQIASHPHLVDPAAVASPFHMNELSYQTARLVELIYDHSRRDVSMVHRGHS